MRRDDLKRLPRRRFLAAGATAVLGATLAACGADTETAATTATDAPQTGTTTSTLPESGTLPATPVCDDGDEPTLEKTEGPYFTPGSPERASLLETGMAGTQLTITGFVLGTDCQPVNRALIDVWQADDAGEYDNSGYRLRGHLFTGAKGQWTLTTVVPGIYPGRTRHIHVKVQAPNGPILTTQLFFPDEPDNAGDNIYDSRLLLDGYAVSGGKATGKFTFVVQAA
jgi:protocatechuate 3,4-dioxygenase beta subunit